MKEESLKMDKLEAERLAAIKAEEDKKHVLARKIELERIAEEARK